MGLTIREAISNVKTDLKKVNSDAHLTNKQVYTVLLKHAEWMVDQLSNAYKLGRRDIVFQTLRNIEVIDVPLVDECSGIKVKCKIKRTKDKLPPMFEDSLGAIIKELTSIDGSTEIKYSDISDFKTKKNNPWGPKDNKYYFFKGGYLYGDLPSLINLTALFKEDINKLNQCDSCGEEKDCTPFLDTIWTVPALLQARIIDYTIKELSPQVQIPNQEMIDKNENNI